MIILRNIVNKPKPTLICLRIENSIIEGIYNLVIYSVLFITILTSIELNYGPREKWNLTDQPPPVKI